LAPVGQPFLQARTRRGGGARRGDAAEVEAKLKRSGAQAG